MAASEEGVSVETRMRLTKKPVPVAPMSSMNVSSVPAEPLVVADTPTLNCAKAHSLPLDARPSATGRALILVADGSLGGVRVAVGCRRPDRDEVDGPGCLSSYDSGLAAAAALERGDGEATGAHLTVSTGPPRLIRAGVLKGLTSTAPSIARRPASACARRQVS